jgi:RNase adaptor protein for sRNA GlmZ degradation
MYVEALMLIQEYGHRQRRGGVAVRTTCGSGTHRSVSMAEELVREVETWGWEVVVMHLDIVAVPEKDQHV